MKSQHLTFWFWNFCYSEGDLPEVRWLYSNSTICLQAKLAFCIQTKTSFRKSGAAFVFKSKTQAESGSCSTFPSNRVGLSGSGLQSSQPSDSLTAFSQQIWSPSSPSETSPWGCFCHRLQHRAHWAMRCQPTSASRLLFPLLLMTLISCASLRAGQSPAPFLDWFCPDYLLLANLYSYPFNTSFQRQLISAGLLCHFLFSMECSLPFLATHQAKRTTRSVSVHFNMHYHQAYTSHLPPPIKQTSKAFKFRNACEFHN